MQTLKFDANGLTVTVQIADDCKVTPERSARMIELLGSQVAITMIKPRLPRLKIKPTIVKATGGDDDD